jgi:solute carrier family 25 oxoglutarate transporter 11
MAEAKQQPQTALASSAAWKTVKPFVNGGASGMLATCVIQPIDMVKVSHATVERDFGVQ